jgi:branched-chain amino acid aminotransferase
MMDIPFTVGEIVEATKETVRSTGLPGCYIRPIAYYGYGEMGLNTLPCSVDVAIACWPWGAYLGDDAVSKGVRMKISSWTRHDHNTMPPASKTTGNYVNSSLAKVEALKAGYDEAIMLNKAGLVSECTGENIFVVRNGRIITPPLSAGALEGITQTRSPRSRTTSGSRWWWATSRAATCTSPTRCSCAAPLPRCRR